MGAKIRWVCPDCGAGRNLGRRPRLNAVSRFCLPCSEKTGYLVPRVAPALEKARRASQIKAQTKAQKARDRKAAEYVVETDAGPLDVLGEFLRMWKVAERVHPPLKTRHAFSTILKRRRPKLSIHRGTGFYSSGYARCISLEVHITTGESKSDILHVLAHEIAHHMRFSNGNMVKNGRLQAHDGEFKSLEMLLHEELGILDCLRNR